MIQSLEEQNKKPLLQEDLLPFKLKTVRKENLQYSLHVYLMNEKF